MTIKNFKLTIFRHGEGSVAVTGVRYTAKLEPEITESPKQLPLWYACESLVELGAKLLLLHSSISWAEIESNLLTTGAHVQTIAGLGWQPPKFPVMTE
jgi:hypothetical protein